MGTYVTEGIILQHQDFRETDRLLTVYTKEYGTIKAVARASRKITSKLGGNLEPFIRANFMIVRGRHGDTVAHVEPLKNFRRLKSNYEALRLGSYIGSVIDRSTKLYQHDARIFDLLLTMLTTLNAQKFDIKSLSHVRWYFLWHYLSLLGYHPEMRTCIVCKKRIAVGNNYFSFKKGGLIDVTCRAAARDSVSVSTNAIKVVRLIFERKVDDIVRVRVTPALSREVDALTNTYVNYVQEQELAMH